jgi:hypothetical protein
MESRQLKVSAPYVALRCSEWSDPWFNEMYDEKLFQPGLSEEELHQLLYDMYMYAIADLPFIALTSSMSNIYWQPRLKNYHGEKALGYGNYAPVWARIWIKD